MKLVDVLRRRVKHENRIIDERIEKAFDDLNSLDVRLKKVEPSAR